MERGDYGSGVVERLSTDDVFISLFEHDPAAAGSPLFAASGPPAHLPPDGFSPMALQRVLSGQSGVQRFFTATDRAFCLYVVLGSHARRAVLAPRAEAIVRTLEVGAFV
jgi:hypothetical protein